MKIKLTQFLPSLLLLFFCLGISPSSNAAILPPPPVEKTKAKKEGHRKAKKARKQQRRFKKHKNKSIQHQNKATVWVATLILIGVFLLLAAFITGIILFILGLVQANPVFWIVGLCIFGLAAIITTIAVIMYTTGVNQIRSS